ncbi:hypothetical protein L211DRAFT_837009 [Terfezia boudieri ATCC MYA-4762]|uniref:Uncharacterized protein n=1 Tax=Terfezia boudieri ATCC MYA-4762 TaxID=1051890 RepID=A0A3N4LU04_9PEZI|nr:hypothetical protein L211DRAFT_837009 [Terfezia boudieri ATCC MYA-4762]
MESQPEKKLKAVSAPKHTSPGTKVPSESYNYQEYEVTSARSLIPQTGPEACYHSLSPSPASFLDPFERSYPYQSPQHLKQAPMAPVPSIKNDKDSQHVSCRPPVEYLPSTYPFNLSGHSGHIQAVARTCTCSCSPLNGLQQYPSGTYGETRSASPPTPGYVNSYQYNDFVLFPGCGHNSGEHCSHPQSTSAHDASHIQPPRAPYIGRLATPELGEEIYHRSTDSMGRLARESKCMGYGEDEGEYLPLVREGMFPGL